MKHSSRNSFAFAEKQVFLKKPEIYGSKTDNDVNLQRCTQILPTLTSMPHELPFCFTTHAFYASTLDCWCYYNNECSINRLVSWLLNTSQLATAIHAYSCFHFHFYSRFQWFLVELTGPLRLRNDFKLLVSCSWKVKLHHHTQVVREDLQPILPMPSL